MKITGLFLSAADQLSHNKHRGRLEIKNSPLLLLNSVATHLCTHEHTWLCPSRSADLGGVSRAPACTPACTPAHVCARSLIAHHWPVITSSSFSLHLLHTPVLLPSSSTSPHSHHHLRPPPPSFLVLLPILSFLISLPHHISLRSSLTH